MSETVTDTAALVRTRADKRRRNAVRWFSVLTVVCVAGLGGLGYRGYELARQMKGGATSKVITDPAAPGFVAAVDPTPVHLLALTNADDALSALIVLVPATSGGGGNVVWSLGELVVDVDGTATSLADVYKSDGLAATRSEFEKVLGFGVSDATVVGPDELSALAEPVSPLTIKNPDPITVESKGKRTEKFKAGTLALDADELDEFLTIRAAGEAPENRSTRAGVVISALAKALAESGNGSATTGGGSSSSAGSTGSTGASAPGDTESSETTGGSSGTSAKGSGDGSGLVTDAGVDLGAVFGSLGANRIDFTVLPMKRQSFSGSFLYKPDAEGIAAKLADVVQFPVSSFPGQRPRVRILNGTSDVSKAKAVAPDVARAGGEVLLVGNANKFDAATTSVVYSSDSFADIAQRIATLFGVKAELSPNMSDAADIDVVIGADYTK
ncbi:MAG: LytR C-terminal domain-containing protein [Acidimicrobiales bacterium]